MPEFAAWSGTLLAERPPHAVPQFQAHPRFDHVDLAAHAAIVDIRERDRTVHTAVDVHVRVLDADNDIRRPRIIDSGAGIPSAVAMRGPVVETARRLREDARFNQGRGVAA